MLLITIIVIAGPAGAAMIACAAAALASMPGRLARWTSPARVPMARLQLHGPYRRAR